MNVNTYFAEHGYISALVRARGLGKSGGEVQFLSPARGRMERISSTGRRKN